MSEIPITKLVWEREREENGVGAMESCVKLYAWISHTILMLIFQIFWKFNQISDYFMGKSIEQSKPDIMLTFSPLTKESKYRRHIRSMSDVQYSTPAPYKLVFRSKVGCHHTLTYDSDTRARRIRAYNIERQSDSSDSSDYFEQKERSLGKNILKHTDSMRIL